jgi:hypothetical protein
MTTTNPIPDSIRPIIAIGSVLPPFALIILAYLWHKLSSDTAIILTYLAYCSVTLLPFLLNAYLCRRHKGVALPGSGRVLSVLFWAIALAPIVGTMATLNNINLQLALALPVVLITGFFVSSLVYLVSALVCAWLGTKYIQPALPSSKDK